MLALGGCGLGGSTQSEEVAGIVERFYSAIEAGDGERACELLSQDALEQLEGQARQRCPAVITRLEYHPAPVAASHVFVTNAQVRLANDELAFLSREPDGWKLTAVACRPAPGRPQEHPADCELKS